MIGRQSTCRGRDIFGGRIDHDRRAMVERTAQNRRGGVVDDQGHADFASHAATSAMGNTVSLGFGSVSA